MPKAATKKKKPKDPKTGAQRQQAYHQRMRALGFSRLGVWVPDERKEEFDTEIGKLQRRWKRAGLYPEN